MVITGFRSMFAMPILALFFYRRSGRNAGVKAALGNAVAHREIWFVAVSYALMLIFFVSATRLTTAANAILLQYTAPIFVALFSWPILGEPVRGREWAAIVGCFMGVAFFFGEKVSLSGWWGNGIAIFSGVACAFDMIFLRMLARVDSMTNDGIPHMTAPNVSPAADDLRGKMRAGGHTFLAVLFGNALTVLLCLPWMATSFPNDGFSWLIIGLLGVFQLGLSFIFFNIGIQWVTAIEGVLLATLEAVLNPLWTALGAGERPSVAALLGGTLLLASVVFYGGLKSSPDFFQREGREKPCGN